MYLVAANAVDPDAKITKATTAHGPRRYARGISRASRWGSGKCFQEKCFSAWRRDVDDGLVREMRSGGVLPLNGDARHVRARPRVARRWMSRCPEWMKGALLEESMRLMAGGDSVLLVPLKSVQGTGGVIVPVFLIAGGVVFLLPERVWETAIPLLMVAILVFHVVPGWLAKNAGISIWHSSRLWADGLSRSSRSFTVLPT